MRVALDELTMRFKKYEVSDLSRTIANVQLEPYKKVQAKAVESTNALNILPT